MRGRRSELGCAICRGEHERTELVDEILLAHAALVVDGESKSLDLLVCDKLRAHGHDLLCASHGSRSSLTE